MAINRVRRLVSNFASLLTSDVVNRASTFVLYALIARYLGAFELGQLSLAITLFFVFQVLAGGGLKTLVTREVARDRTKTGDYLVNGSVIVVVCSLLSLIALVIFVRLMNYSPETTSAILLLSLGVLPFSLSVLNKAVFQAWERMHYIAWANVPASFAKVGLAFLLLWKGYGLYHLILLILASYMVILFIEWWLMLRHITHPHLKIDRHFSIAMIRSTSTFLGINSIMAINTSLDLILLARLTNEIQVGLYSAAVQLITPFTVICGSIILSVFPEMCKRFTTSIEGLKRISGQVLELLLAITLPAVIGLLFLAEPALLFLYGNAEFVLASPVLRVLVWTLILIAFNHVFGYALVASQREKVTLYIIVISTPLKLITGLIFISQYGLIGAAIAVLLTALVDTLLHYMSVSRLLFQVPLGRLVWKPVAAGACMAVYFSLVKGQGFLLTAVTASAVYVVSWLIFMVWSNGGLRQFTAKYQRIWFS